MGDVRRGIDINGSALASQVAEGRTYWFDPSVESAPEPTGRIDLVQGYDEPIVSYRESKDVLRGPWIDAFRGERPPLLHANLLDGELLGHWQPTTRGSAIRMRTFTYRRRDHAEERALEAAATRYARFAGLPVELA
jgi:hypothetical protein